MNTDEDCTKINNVKAFGRIVVLFFCFCVPNIGLGQIDKSLDLRKIPIEPFNELDKWSFRAANLCNKSALSFSEICKRADELCIREFRSGNCVDEWEPSSANLTELQMRDRRMWVYNLVSEFVEGGSLSKQCCGSNSGCAKKLGEVKFSFFSEKSPGLGTKGGYFDPILNRVYINEELIKRLYHPGPLKTFLLHEMGHACERALTSVFQYVTQHSACQITALTRSLFTSEELSCLSLSLPELTSDSCPNPKLSEIFANKVFLTSLNSVANFPRICIGLPDREHPSVKKYLDCFIGSQSFFSSACPPVSEKTWKPAATSLQKGVDAK